MSVQVAHQPFVVVSCDGCPARAAAPLSGDGAKDDAVSLEFFAGLSDGGWIVSRGSGHVLDFCPACRSGRSSRPTTKKEPRHG